MICQKTIIYYKNLVLFFSVQSFFAVAIYIVYSLLRT